MPKRIGVDVGGTFTDLILRDEATGEITATKVPSTPQDPAQGVVRAVTETLPVAERADVNWLVHGHTVGLNALLERRGAVVGLLATAGFRDLIEIRRGDRGDPYDLFWHPPEPLAPRRLRIGIGGRMRADGTELEPLEESAVGAAMELFATEGVECVAIAFINAYANPAHELRAAELVRAAGFAGELSLSHAVSGEYREYERTSTTLIDAYIRPRVGSYLSRLRRDLGDNGVGGTVLVSRSGGGALEIEQASRRPCESIMSGPVGGAQGAARLATELDLGDIVTADVGGTSFDTCMVVDGDPVTLYEGEVVGFPIQTPWVDVRSIGAGGGSLVYVDAGGLLRVGPQSAGADPGPACYGRGGTQPTVTDAALTLGMLGDGLLAGGLRLDADASAAAFAGLRERLGMGADEVARGAMTIAAASMAGAMREITIEQGRDPRRLALIAFGGAGPLFGCLLADELGIGTIVVPSHAGNFSAHGLLDADIVRSAARTHVMALDAAGVETAAADADGLLAELAGEGSQAARREIQLDLRYRGQEHTLTIDLGTVDGAAVDAFADGAEAIGDSFGHQYRKRFGIALADPVEIVSIRARVREVLEHGDAATASSGSRAARTRPPELIAYSMRCDERLEFAQYERAALAPDRPTEGPAIITEETTTTYVDAGWSVAIGPRDALVISSQEASDAS